MSVHITIRDVPIEVRNKLAARAAARGQSLQDYLRGASSAESVEEVLGSIRDRKANAGTRDASPAEMAHWREPAGLNPGSVVVQSIISVPHYLT